MATNPYIGIYESPRREEPRQQPRGVSSLEQTMLDDRDNQLRVTVMSSPPADQVARQTRVAREAGVAPALVDDVDGAERAQNADRLTKVLGNYPAFGRWAAANPRGAVAAQDDHESLGMLGRAWETTKAIPAALSAGMEGAAANLSELYLSVDEIIIPITDPGNARERLDRRRAEAATYRQQQQAARPKGTGFISESALQGFESLPQQLAALAVGAITRSPAAAATTMGLTTGAPAYQEAVRAGKDRPSALRHGIIHGGSEVLFEVGPAQTLLSMSGRPMIKAVSEFFVREVPGEIGTMLVQGFADWVNLNPDKPYSQWVAGLPEDTARTVIATITGGGAQVGAAKLAGQATAATAKLAGRVQQSARARQEAKAIDALGKGAEKSKLRQPNRDPEAFRSAMQEAANDAGTEYIHVSGEAAKAYMQSDSYDPDSDPFAAYEEQANEAAATGGDVVIPIADALTDLVGSKAWEVLKPDMRLTPGGVSPREADTFDSEMEDVLAGLTDEMAASEQADAGRRTAMERLTDSLATKIAGGGYAAPAARTMATVLATRAQTRYERQGFELTGNEYDNLTVKSVLPEVAKPFVTRTEKGVDVSPDLIREVKSKRGPSLLDFVTKRGGISDLGGDLKSMGFAPLKGKSAKGQRKIISDSADAVDRVFEAAIEAGYFPDILGSAQETYADLPDPAVFLKALDSEYRGAPVYAQGQATEAADALRAMLEQAGYDPAKMSAKDIRDVIAEFDQRDERPGYEQDLFDAENATDPAKADAAKQRLKLRAEAPLRGENRTGKAQDGTMGLGLFDTADQSSLFQTYGEGARARVIFDQQTALVELFANKNLSSFLHETGHIWLEELRFDASLDGAPQQVRDDWQKVQDWFTANGHPLDNGMIPVEAHELWARGVERYLMEGKAPSSALTRIFETFRGWLTQIYKTVDALRSPITPEIRGVMDRLIATDEEIAAANERQNIAALFKQAADVAMSAQAFEAYQAQVAEARADAHGKLLDKTMRVVRARETKRWRDSRETLLAETAEAMDATPLLRSLAAMKTQPISAEWLSGEGIDPATLPVRVPPIVKPGGADPQIIAELAGFATARDMLTALQTAQAAYREAKEGGDKRSMRQRMIEESTDAEMERRYGDPLNDGSIEREALEAVHSDMQGEVIATELRVLSRKSGKRATPYALAKDWARNRIRSGKVADEASPSAIQRYARAAAKAGREAEAAMLKQDADEAFRQKQYQMLNNALVSEAKRAEDEVNAAVKYLGGIAALKTRKSIDQDYLEQAQALLEDYDFRRRTNKELDERGRFEAWAAAQAASGNEVYVPERLAPVGTNWKAMTVEQLVALDDTVKSILHVGRRKKELQVGKDKRDFNEARGEWLQAAEPLAERPVSDARNPERSKLRGLFSNFVRIDMMAKIMDGGDPNGLMTRVLAYGSKQADNTYARIQKQVLEPLVDAYMAMKGDRLHNRISVPEWIDWRTGEPAVFMRSDLIAVALNLGNESNLRKMIAGEALLFKGQEANAPTQAGIEQMLARELNEAEWKLVETAWQRVESMWPEIVADERERTGITPEKVESRAVQTPFGTLEGGYWPAVYDGDPAKAAAAGINLAEYKSGDLESILGIVGKGVATNKGHTITRTDFVAPMYLNFEGVLFGHVNQVAKRIAYQSWATNALKVIRDPRIKAMWARKLGEEYHDQLEPWLRQTINQGAVADTAHLADFNGILKQARMNLTVMGLVFRFTTMLAQIGGLTSSIQAIGARNVLNGYALCAADYGANKARIYEASPLMARRINEFDRDQAAALAEMSNPPKTALGRTLKPVADKRDRWNAAGFHAIGAIQLHLVDLPTWAGAYAQATGAKGEGGLDMTHDDAVDYADLKVEQAQGAGRASQLAAVQRAGEMARILTLFYTFFGTQLNYQWEMTQDLRNGRNAKAVRSAFWVMIATPLLGGLIADAIRGDLPDGDDDDTWLAWVMRKVFFGMFNNIPIVRDFSNTFERKAAGKFAPDPQTPWQRVASGVGGGMKDGFAGVSQTDWYQDAERLMPFLPDPVEVSDKWIKHTIEAMGFATGTGLGQIATTGQFAIDVANDDADPDGLADWQQGIVTGRIKED